jgi:hypothetical protein
MDAAHHLHGRFLLGERPWANVKFTFPSQLPTMISEEERRYLHWLGKSFWTGQGNLVEIGPWLGGSTYCLASGMAENPAKAGIHKLFVYDSFEWRPFMAARAKLPLEPGASFQPYFEQNVQAYRDLIVAERRVLPDDAIPHDPVVVGVRHVAPNPGDVLRWESSRPIEVLFVDGAKSWDGLLHLLKETHGSLVAGRSLIVCQDYKHWSCYWVAAIIELLSDRFQLQHLLDYNTVAFLLLRKLERSDIDALPTSATLDADTGARMLERAAERLAHLQDPLGAALLRLGKVHFLAHKGNHERAVQEFRRVEATWTLRPPRPLEETRRWLSERTGLPLSPTIRARAIHFGLRMRRVGRRLSKTLLPSASQR